MASTSSKAVINHRAPERGRVPRGIRVSSAYGGNVMLRADAKNFYRGGLTSGIYKIGAIANIGTFHRAVMGRDFSNPTLEPSLTSNLVAIMGRISAQEKRTVTWADVLGSKKVLQTDLSGLQA